MDQPVELVPLVCLKCTTPIPAEVDEVAWVCAQCGQGMLLDEEQGLQPLEVCYAAGLKETGRPYWVAEGQVSLQRHTYSGNRNDEAQTFWSQPRRFFVPAFSCTLEALLSQGMEMLTRTPDLQEGPPARFDPVTLALEDVQAAADFIVVALEAGRKDKLKEINFSLQLSPPVLWILP